MSIRPIMLTVAQAVEATGLSRKTLYLLRRRGELLSVKIGSSVRFRYSDLEALAERSLDKPETPQSPEK